MNQVENRRRQIEICSRMLGLINLLILGNIVGNNGVAYVAAAMEIFVLFWNLTGAAVSGTLGRMLRGRNAKGQYRNVAKMRRCALVLQGAAGLGGSLLMILLAVPAARYMLKFNYSVAIIVLLAPAVFLRTISSVLLGYFQGEGTELPAVISAVMRQLCILLFGMWFARLLQGYGSKVSALLVQENFTAMYGGMGIALAISVTELIILLFLFLVYRGSRVSARRSNEGMRATDDFGSQARSLYGNMFPQIVGGVLRFLPLLLGLVFYQKAGGASSALEQYGVFYGKYIALCGMVILPNYALLMGACNKTAGCMRRDEHRFARNYFWGGLHIGVVQALFWTVLFAVLAPQLAGTFCKSDPVLAEEMLKSGSALILFVVLESYCAELLRALGGKYLVLGILAVNNIVFTVSVTVMLNAGGQSIMALVYAGLIAEGFCTVVSGSLVCYRIQCGIDWIRGFAVPAGAACVTGLPTLFLAKAVTPHLGNPAAVVLCTAAAGVLYVAILLLLRNFRGQDAGYMPWGNLLRMAGRWLKLR